jgi:hypothetical protein
MRIIRIYAVKQTAGEMVRRRRRMREEGTMENDIAG